MIEWPDRIPQPRVTRFRASTSDLLPTLCELVGQPLPERPIDGISLAPAIEGDIQQRPTPLYFWQYDTGQLNLSQLEPWIKPELQQGTTPLVKLMGGKLTRDFRNVHHPEITESDYRGDRSIIHENYKLILKGIVQDELQQELYHLQEDPAETNDLASERPETAKRLAERLHQWQSSVLNSLTGADYSE